MARYLVCWAITKQENAQVVISFCHRRTMVRTRSTKVYGGAVAVQDKAIILGGTHGGLAIARSLHQHGIKFLVLTIDKRQSGLKSRYIKEWYVCPHPRDEEAFIDNLLSYADAWQGALIMPTTDFFAGAVSRNKAKLGERYVVGVSDWNQAKIFLEKDETYLLADEVGVHHPYFFQPKSMEELEEQIPRMQMPVMIKPVHSHSFTEIFHTKLFICETLDDLRANFQRALDANQEVVVSEIIPGSDYKTLETVQVYIDSKGEIAATFCCIKLRQIPPMYGVIRVGRSMEPSEELIEAGLKLLKHIDYRGYASIEFKRDPRDNKLKLMEVNMRALQMGQLPIASGVDFPYMMFQDLIHDEQIHVHDYNPEMHYIEVAADVVCTFFVDEERSLSRFLEPYRAKHKTFPYFRLNDPMPFLYDSYTRGAKLVRKALKSK